MLDPIIFVSHFTIRSGKLGQLKQLANEVTRRLELDKPRTVLYLVYFDRDGTQASFLHLFADPEAMDLHFDGAQERSREALEFMDPNGWEVYGQPSDAALEAIRQAATSAGVPLTIQPEYIAGFVRL